MSRSAAHRELLGRLLRYASVSLISTATGLSVLGILVAGFDFPGVWANVIATAIGTIPSFELNRRWVWRRGGTRVRPGQVAGFCLLSLAGLVVSTVAVHLGSDATVRSGRLVHTVVVELANVASYGLLWLVQFALCDRVLFASRGTAVAASLPAGENELAAAGAGDRS